MLRAVYRVRTISLALLALLTIALEPPPRAIPARATVVILTGMPGDVESEQAYDEQFRNLRELAPANAVVLRNPTREQFLAAGKSLSNAESVVVIAWGHGGLQGHTPVFHVTGPRIAATDFKTFAGNFAGKPSQWFLFFRASGLVAKELAAPDRQIISSERDTIFNSDPVGLPLLTKILRADPGIAMPALADKLGRATAAWYADRHLARTEEPTHWAGNDPPKLLAPAEAEEADTLASEPRETTSTNATWNITRVEPRSFPDADAVILRRRIELTLADSPAIRADHEEFIQILTTEGKRHGDFDISYSPPHEDVTFLDCEVQQPDGKVVRLNPDAIRDVGGNNVGDYVAPSRKIFSLPGVVPGAILHVHYRSEWRTYPLPHVTVPVPVADELPVRELAVRVTVPKNSPLHFLFDDATPRDPEISQTGYGTTFAWEFRDVSAHVREVLTPPMRQPALLLSTFPDWASFAGWYERIARHADDVTPEISAKSAELTRGATNDLDKVRALYHFVTNLRYIAVPLGVNSHRPHAAAHVLENQFGDCKDKANLLNTLCRAAGITAHLVLVPRFSQAHEALPGFAFNHAISRVTLPGQTLWIDTTDDTCPFGLLPPGDPGRRVLVIASNITSLAQLPAPIPAAHTLTLRITAGGIEASATGFCDYDWRAVASELVELRTTMPLIAARFRPTSGVFAMSKQSFTPVAALDENFTWHAEGAMVAASGATFWLPREWDAALHARRSPLFLNHGYPMTLDETIDGAKPLPVSENTEPPLRWKVQSGTLHVELAGGDEIDSAKFQRQYRALLNALTARTP